MIATTLHPHFKKIHVKNAFPTADIQLIEDRIVREMETITHMMATTPTTVPMIQDTEILDFFNVDIIQDQEQSVLADNAKVLTEYFASSNKNLELLLDPKFQSIKKLFVKYNTKLLSSAACERLFSMAKHIMTASRTLLGDEKFEKLLILKCSDLLKV